MESITQTFAHKSVAEVIDLEKKTRHEIELKKEELRQMVGERYRDLIEAADTINEMKVCSTKVKDSVKDLQQFYTGKNVGKGKRLALVKKQMASKTINRYMEISSQAKVLMEIPEKIWSHVENSHMISASFLYLQSLHVLKNLSLDGTTTYSPILLWFPMLGQQAQAVGNLRTAILKECHDRIQDHLLHVDRLAEALCSIIILEKITCAEVLQVLLNARAAALSNVLNEDFATGESRKNVGAKSRICDSVSILQQTVLHVYHLFCKDNIGLVAQLLSKCVTDSETTFDSFLSQNDSSKIWIKHLPKGITCFKAQDADARPISSDVVQSFCLGWFAKCKEKLTAGIKHLLTFTSSAKDLSSIRNELLDILGHSNEDSSANIHSIDDWAEPKPESPVELQNKAWASSCKVIFNRKLNLWSELLQNLFLEKIDFLVKDTFSKLLESSKVTFSLSPNLSMQSDAMTSYVWQESDTDITPNMAWCQWQNRKHGDFLTQGGLSLKVASVTPNIRRALEELNELMLQLLTDLSYCVPGLLPAKLNLNQVSQEQSKFNETENSVVTERLKTCCYQYLQSLQAHIAELEVELSTSRSCVNNILRLSLLCRNFFDLCHYFKHCCCPVKNILPSTFKRQLSGNVVGKALLEQSSSVDSAWNGVVDAMMQRSHSLMDIWCKIVLNDALEPYKTHLLRSSSNGNLLNCVALWDTLTVEEENESGDKVTSQIKVPASVTSYTQNFLYTLCSELRKIGGHSASRLTLRNLSQNALKGVYKAFSEARRTLSAGDANLHGQSRTNAASSTPSQTWALQCLFDLRYVHSLLYQASLEEEDDDKLDEELEEDLDSPFTYTELVDWLEGYVDPFDLDVFAPHVTRNIQRYVARTSIMLGMLTSPEKLNTVSSQKFAASSKDSHNVLPLAPDCGRFSYLPVSGRNSVSRSSHRTSNVFARELPLASALRQLTNDALDADEKQHSRSSSSLYSKLGAFSSSWLNMSSQNVE